jgi:hypothetical protein
MTTAVIWVVYWFKTGEYRIKVPSGVMTAKVIIKKKLGIELRVNEKVVKIMAIGK